MEIGNVGADTCWLPLVINQLVGVCVELGEKEMFKDIAAK